MTLVFSGSEWVEKLCKKVFDDCEINKGGSPRGLALVDKIELLQDKRIHHFKHEWLALWLSYGTNQWILYLERSWDHESDEGWQAWIPPLIGERTIAGEDGQQKSPEYDIAMFFKEGDEEEQERRGNAATLFDIEFRRDASCSQPLTLRSVCEILLDYHGKHPAYILLGANCWAWSRAVLLVITFRSDNVRYITMSTKAEPVSTEQFKMYLFTEYGAWGGMLLHVIASRKDSTEYSLLRLAFMRILLVIYPFVSWIAWLKTRLFGYINWTFRLRRFIVRERGTTTDSGVDCTYTVFPPDLTDLIPALFGRSVSPLAHKFCTPGDYLYLLTPPVAALNARILSVHIFLFGIVRPDNSSDDAETGDAMENDVQRSDVSNAYFECGILRNTIDGLSLVPEPNKCGLDVTLRPMDKRNRRSYAGIHALDSRHPLVRALRGGDMIALWAKSSPRLVHEPAIASVKVVAQRNINWIDITLVVDMLYTLLRTIKSLSDNPVSSRSKSNVKQLSLRLFAYTPYFLDKFCGNWLWSIISEVAKQLMWSVTPLILPISVQEVTEMSFNDFLQCVSPPASETDNFRVTFGRATVVSLEIISFQPHTSVFKRLVVEVRYQGLTYIMHFEQPSDQDSIRKHYFSFLWSSTGFTQDFVKIFKPGEAERSARTVAECKFELKVHFNLDGDAPKLFDLARILIVLKRDYWWFFWLNSQNWSWPYTACRNLCMQFEAVVEKVDIDGCEGPLGSMQQASMVLKDRCEGWKHAELRSYSTWKGITTGEDMRYLLNETRARFLVWYFAIGVLPVLVCLQFVPTLP